MKITGLSERAEQFVAKYMRRDGDPGIPLVSQDGAAYVRVVERGERLRVTIELDEDATHESLREVDTYALRWRDLLLWEQGPWIVGGRNSLMVRLEENKQTPAAQAAWVNQKIADLLRAHLEHTRGRERELEDAIARGHRRTDLNWIYMYAYDLLCALGFSGRCADDVLNEALDRMRNGLRPFVNRNDPVHRARVERALRTWRDSRKGKAWRKLLERNSATVRLETADDPA